MIGGGGVPKITAAAARPARRGSLLPGTYTALVETLKPAQSNPIALRLVSGYADCLSAA